MTATEGDIYFPNTTWRRCLAHSKGEGEGSCIKTKICRDRGNRSEEEEERSQNEQGAEADEKEACCCSGKIRSNNISYCNSEVLGNESAHRGT